MWWMEMFHPGYSARISRSEFQLVKPLPLCRSMHKFHQLCGAQTSQINSTDAPQVGTLHFDKMNLRYFTSCCLLISPIEAFAASSTLTFAETDIQLRCSKNPKLCAETFQNARYNCQVYAEGNTGNKTYYHDCFCYELTLSSSCSIPSNCNGTSDTESKRLNATCDSIPGWKIPTSFTPLDAFLPWQWTVRFNRSDAHDTASVLPTPHDYRSVPQLTPLRRNPHLAHPRPVIWAPSPPSTSSLSLPQSPSVRGKRLRGILTTFFKPSAFFFVPAATSWHMQSTPTRSDVSPASPLSPPAV